MHRYLQKRMHDLEIDGLGDKEPLLAKCYAPIKRIDFEEFIEIPHQLRQ
jgi:hypothetical protein